MGNQGYPHDATRVACEIFWAGEIGEVKEVYAWEGRGVNSFAVRSKAGIDAQVIWNERVAGKKRGFFAKTFFCGHGAGREEL